jgi:hypothetical protein
MLHGELVLRALPCSILLDVALPAGPGADVVCICDQHGRAAGGLALEHPPAERHRGRDCDGDDGYEEQPGMQDEKTYSRRCSDALHAVRMLADELTPRIARGR